MSAFLGPIHYWLYKKIQLQDSLVHELTTKLENDDVLNVDTKIGALPKGDLQDIIDGDNIHGWLQEKIHLVERRLSYVVEALCKEGVSFEKMCNIAYEVGTHNTPLKQESTALDAFNLLNDVLLDGMPCDHVNVIKVQEEWHVEWTRQKNIHDEFWNDESKEQHRYDDLRGELIRGLLAPTNLVYSNKDYVSFTIERRP